ncbi:MAG TPA: diguanylate cyclase, partial [Duganella sp.]|nr:diguanylate cyclase [Duganella sp.]
RRTFSKGAGHTCVMVDVIPPITATDGGDMSLSEFIPQHIDTILDEWTRFATTLAPRKHKLDQTMLLDHARHMLEAIAADLALPESAVEQTKKSKGQGRDRQALRGEQSAATQHGVARMHSGFSLIAAVSEYRALRASVTRLWERAQGNQPMPPAGVVDLIRFNEAIDQALSESVTSYYFEKEQRTRVFDAILSSTPDLSFTFDLDGKFTYANKALLDLLHLPLHEVLEKNHQDLGIPDAAEKDGQVRFVIHSAQHVRGEGRFAPPPAPAEMFEYILVPVVGEDGHVEAVAGTARNITDRKAEELRNWRRANFDPLTGLPNRCLFSDRLEQEVRHACRSGAPIALLFIDLDKFKDANDRYGHDAGDLLLHHAAARMRSCVRETDTVARLGGDEFTILLQDLGENGHVENVASKILRQMEKPFHIQRHDIGISASIGIALAPSDADTPDALMAHADHAMYVSKAAGGNRFSFFSRAKQ